MPLSPLVKPVQGPANVTAAAPLVKPPASPTQPGLLQRAWTGANDFVDNTVKPWASGVAGDLGGQFSAAKTHYGLSRAQGQNPFQAGLGAFGQLHGTTRGLAGGAAGMLGAGMLAPRGTRSWAMPLMTGLGAAAATANGPGGFKLENMLKPEALTAGALGAGAGFLGSQLLGDDDGTDDEEETDLLGNRRPTRRSDSGFGLGSLAGLAGLGAGAYGLYNLMGSQGNGLASQSAVRTAQDTAGGGIQGGATGGGGVAQAGITGQVGNNTGAVPPAGNAGVAPQGSGVGATPPLPATISGPNPAAAGPAGTPAAAPGDAAPPRPTPAAPDAMRAALPRSPAMQGFVDNPQAVGDFAKRLIPQQQTPAWIQDPEATPTAPAGPIPGGIGSSGSSQPAMVGNVGKAPPGPPGVMPSERQSVDNLLASFHQSEIPGLNTTGFPQLSEIYRKLYTNNDPTVMERAKGYISALDNARQAAGIPEWESLNRLEALQTDPNTGATTPKLQNMQFLGAFGFKDLDSLAEAASAGSPQALQALRVAGPEFRQQLLSSMTEKGYHQFKPLGANAPVHLPAAAVSPRAAALAGTLQAANLAEPLTPAPYDPKALLGGVETIRNLPPEQKAQLLRDIADKGFGERFSSYSPEERQSIARNLAGALARNAYTDIRTDAESGKQVPGRLSGYLDDVAQQAVAGAGGIRDYKGLSIPAWNTLSSQGIGPAQLGPYDHDGKIWSPQSLVNTSRQVDPADMVLGRGASNKVLDDWQKVMIDQAHGRSNLSDDQLNAMGVNMRRMVEADPQLYDQLITRLQQASPEVEWSEQVPEWLNDPQLDQTGQRFTHDGRRVPVPGVAPQRKQPAGLQHATFYD